MRRKVIGTACAAALLAATAAPAIAFATNGGSSESSGPEVSAHSSEGGHSYGEACPLGGDKLGS